VKNPFYLKPLPLAASFCNREKEIEDLVRHAKNCTNVVLSSPRRFGKTSLVKRVQKILKKKNVEIIYIDFFGVASIEEVASKLAAGIYSIVYKEENLLKKTLKFFLSLRPVIKPDPETGISMTMEVIRGKNGPELLEETMKGLSDFLAASRKKYNVAIDEFQEITELKESLSIEGIMRTYIQHQQNVSYFFIGSRRRILSDIFNNKKRAFYKSAINYSLPALPSDATVKYIIDMFKRYGKSCSKDIAKKIYEVTKGYPYYLQKLSYYIFDIIKHVVRNKELHQGIMELLNEETMIFEVMLQNLKPGQISFLYALAKEPIITPFNIDYLTRHRLGSIGGIQSAIKKLVSLDYIEKTPSGWKVIDPIFALWLRKKEIIE